MSCCKTGARLDASRVAQSCLGEDYALEEHALDVHIHALRQKVEHTLGPAMDSHGQRRWLQTFRRLNSAMSRLEGTNYPIAESTTWFYIGNKA